MKNIFKSIGNSITNTATKVKFDIQKNSPTICLVIGIIGVGAAIVVACKETLSLPDIIENVNDQKEELDKKYADEKDIVEIDEDGETHVEPNPEKKAELRTIYVRAAFDIAKLYIPAILITSLSIALIIHSHMTLVSRGIALSGAYMALRSEFEEYRKNVRNRFGEDIDKQMRFGINPQTNGEQTNAENNSNDNSDGQLVLKGPNPVGRTRFLFDETTSSKWQKDWEYNMLFLQSLEHDFNETLRANKSHVFLSDILDALGIEQTQSSRTDGWFYDREVEHKISFGLYKYEDFDGEVAMWLDFNIDGDIMSCLAA